MTFWKSARIALTALTIGSLLIVGINPAQARLTSGSIKITIDKAESGNTNKRQLSMKYVSKALRIQKENPTKAAEFYKKAVEIDELNPWAYIASGDFLYDLGETTTGVECVTAGGTLAKAQGDEEAYEIAMAWLSAHGEDSE
jgi:tetratricopeptide (TPR) repeat protein